MVVEIENTMVTDTVDHPAGTVNLVTADIETGPVKDAVRAALGRKVRRADTMIIQIVRIEGDVTVITLVHVHAPAPLVARVRVI